MLFVESHSIFDSISDHIFIYSMIIFVIVISKREKVEKIIHKQSC